MSRLKTTINFGITVPKPAFERLEKTRGYYSRSKFILMALDALAATIENNSLYSGQAQVSSPATVDQNTESVSTVGEYNVS